MRSSEEFSQFYTENLYPRLIELEKQRVKSVKGFCLSIPIFAVSVYCVMKVFKHFYQINPLTFDTKIFFIGIFVFLVYLSYARHFRDITSQFKKDVIEDTVHFISSHLDYQSTKYVPRELFEMSGFFHAVQAYTGEDLVAGHIGQTSLGFSEVRVGKKRSYFSGLFFVADFHKKFAGETYVMPDRLNEKMKWMAASVVSNKKHVHLEDSVFEKNFIVHSTDQVEARYILSLNLMQRILTLQDKIGKDIYLSFVKSFVFVVIPLKKNLFEAPIFRSVTKYPTIESYFNILNLLVGMVEDLNLNTRIWSKS